MDQQEVANLRAQSERRFLYDAPFHARVHVVVQASVMLGEPVRHEAAALTLHLDDYGAGRVPPLTQ